MTLRLLREQSDPLMWYVKYFNISQTISTTALSILKTFIHDPLVEWNRGRVRNESKEMVQYHCSLTFNINMFIKNRLHLLRILKIAY